MGRKQSVHLNEAVFGRAANVEILDGRRQRYEVSQTGESPALAVSMWPEIEVRIELPGAPEIQVVRGCDVPQVSALYLLVQPEVVADDWRCGWSPVGGEWPSEVHLREQIGLCLGDLDVAPVMWAFADRLEFEKSGSLPMHIVVGTQA